MADDRLTHAEFVKRVARETQIAQKYVREVLETTPFPESDGQPEGFHRSFGKDSKQAV